MGQIYKITNTINGKVYIGQTKYTADIRLRGHIADMDREGKQDYPLYRAFRKYGLQNFRLDVLEECESDKLGEREIYYINMYASFSTGYNQTLGGGGTRHYNLDESSIVKEYSDTNSITYIANRIGVSTIVIKNILMKNGIQITSGNSTDNIGVIQIDALLKPINHFESKQEAYEWLVENHNKDLKRSTFYYYTKRAYETYGKFSGYYWVKSEDNYQMALDNIASNIVKYGNSKNISVPSKEELTYTYAESKMNKEETGRKFSVTGATVARWLKKYNIH